MDFLEFAVFDVPAHEAAYVLAEASSAPSAPRISCAISMRSWCIVGLDGRIQMSDDGNQRVWSIKHRLYMREGPLVIVESKSCDGVDRAEPRNDDRLRGQAQTIRNNDPNCKAHTCNIGK